MTGITHEQFYVLLAGAAFCFVRLGWGLHSGSVGFFLKKYDRYDQPVSFWSDMIICGGCGVISAGAAACAFFPALSHYSAGLFKFIDRVMASH